nr:MAG: RNA-dependent RNA polymerase [Permutotetraviridae sp.]
MDASNPVANSSRCTLEVLESGVMSAKRQDLELLTKLAEGADRLLLTELPTRPGVDMKNARKEAKELIRRLPQHPPKGALDVSFLEIVSESAPISGLVFEGAPLHPPGVNQKGGSVSVNRLFGPATQDHSLLPKILMTIQAPEAEAALTKLIYSRGTATGLSVRMRKQMLRPTKSSLPALKKFGYKDLRGPLKEALPINPQELWDLSEDLDSLLDKITVTANASAGPPYWADKSKCVTVMRDAVIPLIYTSIMEGRLGDLEREQPELFLAECKNKMDRYEIEKLEEKTRPYFNFPFHWTALFSILSQSYSKALKVFHQGGNNAYGFSWAHGGAGKLVEWAQAQQEVTGKTPPGFIAYGDDVDIYYRLDGQLHRISPDFTQMDGSVDSDTVSVVVDMVVDAHAPPGSVFRGFWVEVGKVWKRMALNPNFLLDGTTVYRKPKGEGLATGVVGTTLFDTAKSVLAYKAWALEVASGKRDLLEESPARRYFQEAHGLEIKEGTWNPQQVPEPAEGGLFSPNKFLGMQIVFQRNSSGELRPYPHLPLEDWLQLLLVEKRDQVQSESAAVANRRAFDRLRGLMVTGAFSNPEASRLIGNLLNTTPANVILMQVQLGGGRGAPPEYAHLDDGNFVYPSSSGLPTGEWCRALYDLDETPEMPEAYPGLRELIPIREAKLVLKRAVKGNVLVSYAEAAATVPEKNPGDAPKSKPPPETISISSARHDIQITNGVLKLVPRKFVPNRTQAITEMMGQSLTPAELESLAKSPDVDFVTEKGPAARVLPLPVVADRLGISIPKALEAVKEAGFIVLEANEGEQEVLPRPLDTSPSSQMQAKEYVSRVKDKGLSAKGSELKRAAAIQEDPIFEPRAVRVIGDHPYIPKKLIKPDNPSPWVTAQLTMHNSKTELSSITRTANRGTYSVVTATILWKKQGTTDQHTWLEAEGRSRTTALFAAGEFIKTLVLRRETALQPLGSDWNDETPEDITLRLLEGKVTLMSITRSGEIVVTPKGEDRGWTVESRGMVISPKGIAISSKSPTVTALFKKFRKHLTAGQSLDNPLDNSYLTIFEQEISDNDEPIKERKPKKQKPKQKQPPPESSGSESDSDGGAQDVQRPSSKRTSQPANRKNGSKAGDSPSNPGRPQRPKGGGGARDKKTDGGSEGLGNPTRLGKLENQVRDLQKSIALLIEGFKADPERGSGSRRPPFRKSAAKGGQLHRRGSGSSAASGR